MADKSNKNAAEYRIRSNETVGYPYYQPDASDSPAERRIRSAAQRKYMDENATGMMGGDQNEGIFADTVRTAKNLMAGKRGRDAISHGDEGLMAGARKAGREGVQAYRDNPTDSTFKKGGKVSASKRADGIAQRGKTKGRCCDG
jgi:hypothetical protein